MFVKKVHLVLSSAENIPKKKTNKMEQLYFVNAATIVTQLFYDCNNYIISCSIFHYK